MAEQRQASVIRRKTRAAREGADPRVMSPVRALRLALARAADTLLDLPLVVATVEQCRVEAGEVEATLGTEGLYLLLDGAAGARAAMRLCPGLVAALVEVQTTGRVRPGEVRARAPTRTDAAMVAPLVDALLSGFDDGMGESGADQAPRGFHFGDRVEDARALALLLVAPEFDFFRLTVDLGPGLRTGWLDLLLPPAPPVPARDVAPAGRGAPARDPENVAAVALTAPVALDAVLARIRVPLRAAMAFEVGQRLEVARDTLGKVRLVGAGGYVAAEGRLGRRDGWRALRLAGTGADEGDETPRATAMPGTTGASRAEIGAPETAMATAPEAYDTMGQESVGQEMPGHGTSGADAGDDMGGAATAAQGGTALAPVSG
ncbi:FliM/FliN family flagellar motor C-terminal domain-containing protein [Roseovarius nitratireducens]|uniref:FliM/FliN family flagellar motor C-terminal domain-containing protein n=1 Tax=Roseovarius nitratireducens TaxID=2044597 RepID=UPI000CE20A00|nr:FliM/FliN family flagellar motor C-terminal domain-containing protein [Roseovarius nitratireducens]